VKNTKKNTGTKERAPKQKRNMPETSKKKMRAKPAPLLLGGENNRKGRDNRDKRFKSLGGKGTLVLFRIGEK